MSSRQPPLLSLYKTNYYMVIQKLLHYYTFDLD
nr:MAG TPA: hypothetical protein [Caudoviricetes sp.]